MWFFLLACAPKPQPSPSPPPAPLAEIRAQLWDAHRAAHAQPLPLSGEHSVSRGGHTMRYTIEARGAQPDAGWPVYIALHGGGGAPAEVNDAQWASMQGYYADSIDVGLYIAPRGISDTWNLHFQDASYPLYDALIEQLIAAGADPDRVYLMGFSAGGDGVYQIAPRMADRFAAAAMSAGHHNGVSPVNLYALPFLLQVGELDDAYDRARATAEQSARLDALRAAHPGGYVHDLFVHIGGQHNRPWSDRDPSGATYPVVADPARWLAEGDGGQRQVDASSARWLRAHTRNPRPARIRWEPALSAAGRWRYWAGTAKETATHGALVDVSLEREANTITVHAAGTVLLLRLDEAMVDLSAPVVVVDGAQRHTILVEPDTQTLSRTLSERGDPQLMFPVELRLDRRTHTLTQVR